MIRAVSTSGLAFSLMMSNAMAQDGQWHPVDMESGTLLEVGSDIFPDGLQVGDRPVEQVRIYPEGLITLDNRLEPNDRQPPGPLADLRFGGVVAPFWAELDPGACGAPSEIQWMFGAGGLTVEWKAIPTADCDPADLATMTFKATISPGGDGAARLKYEYFQPRETGVFEARAGVVLNNAADTVIELFPDDGAEVAPDRVKALVDGSSERDNNQLGIWVIDLNGDGRVAGDRDLDGIRDEVDNCPEDANPLQRDHDDDAGAGGPWQAGGDVCDADDDNDFHFDAVDNCRWWANPTQSDNDGDGLGDVCDGDLDGDGVWNFVDVCWFEPDPGQEDSDGDGIGDACDPEVTPPLTVMNPIVIDQGWLSGPLFWAID